MPKFQEKTSCAVGASLNSLAECDHKMFFPWICVAVWEEKGSGRVGLCGFSLSKCSPEFLSPAHWISHPASLAASLENSWIYFILAILLHSVQIFALTLLVFGRSWPRVSCLIKITWIWSEALAVGEQFLLTFLPLLFPKRFYNPGFAVMDITDFLWKGWFLCHCPIFHVFPQCDHAKSNWVHSYVPCQHKNKHKLTINMKINVNIDIDID